MEVRFKSQTEFRLRELAAARGRTVDELVKDVVVGYLEDLTEVRDLIEGRYHDVESGRVEPIDGEEYFAALRRRQEARESRRRSQ